MNTATPDADPGRSMPNEPDRGSFEQIEEAVQGTERGRWFLSEFSRRQRAVETAEILTALERLTRRMVAYESGLSQSQRGGANSNEVRPDAIASEIAPAPRPRCDLSERLVSLREIDALDTEAKVRMFA